MSTMYSAVLVVGLPFYEVENAEELSADGKLSLIQPYFDAPYEDCLLGVIAINSGEYSYVTAEHLNLGIQNAHKIFTEVTGLVGKVFLSVDSY